jgi:hypothetical protein
MGLLIKYKGDPIELWNKINSLTYAAKHHGEYLLKTYPEDNYLSSEGTKMILISDEVHHILESRNTMLTEN